MLGTLVLLVFVVVGILLFDQPGDEKSFEIVGISKDENGGIDELENAVESKLGKPANGLLLGLVSVDVVGVGVGGVLVVVVV